MSLAIDILEHACTTIEYSTCPDQLLGALSCSYGQCHVIRPVARSLDKARAFFGFKRLFKCLEKWLVT
jgi:hypothetical protein